MEKIIDDIKNVTVSMTGNIISVNLQNCTNPACRQIVLLHIIRLQSDCEKLSNRRVEVRINDKDIRRFRVPDYIDGGILQSGLLSDKVLQKLKQ